MKIILAGNVEIYSHPLGGLHKSGYEALVNRVCQIRSCGTIWTGFVLVQNKMLTTGFYPHGNEFDVEFPGEKETSAFMLNDFGDILELGVESPHEIDGLYFQNTLVKQKQRLFVIGSFFGIPFTLATCVVEGIIDADHIIDDERLKLLDEHSPGSPVFNEQGCFVGILEAFIENTNKMVIRTFMMKENGVLTG